MKNLLVMILKILRNVIAALLVLAILATVVLRGSNYLHHKFQLKNGVNETTYLDLNGQEQYVMMLGEDISNPVIIYLHGGPASPDTYISYSFADYLTADYTFIGWDQRGCGRTYFRNEERDPGNDTATFAQALDDLDQLVSNAYDATMEFGCPVCFISGAQDWVCPADRSEAYLDALNAPAKKMYRVDGCGHDVHCASPEEFSEDVISFLRNQDIR